MPGLMFLHPWMLWGLLAGSIPIIIHLLNKRRYRPVPWAAMKFLREAIRVNARRIQIEDLILLALRCLIFILVALAFTLPVLRNRALFLGSKPHVAAVLLIDDSWSMNYVDGESSRFERARQAARDYIRNLRRGDSVSVILTSENPRRLFREPTFELDLARDLIGRLECSYSASGIERALEMAREDLGRAREGARSVCVISDFQKGLLAGPAVEAHLKALAKDADLIAVPIGDGYDSNLAVAALEPDSGVVAANVPTVIHARVHNYGQASQNDYPVELFIDEQRRDRRWVDVPPGGEVDVTFLIDFKEVGQHAVEVRLPSDSLPTDNSRYHIIDVRQKVPILLVSGESGGGSVVGATEYIGTALAPGWLVKETEEDHLMPTRVTPAQLHTVDLEQYPMIFLIDVPSLEAEQVGLLEGYVRGGGGLMIVPGERIDPRRYNDGLYRDGQGLMPAKIAMPGFHKEDGDCFLSPEGYGHPTLTVFADGSHGDLSQIKFEQTLLVDPPTSASRVVCKFSSGRPAIIERMYGKGRVMLLASGLGRQWGNLVWKPSFLILTRRMTDYLMRREGEGLNLGIRDTATRFQRGGSAATALTVTNPKGESAVAELESAVGGITITAGRADYPGVYKLTPEGEKTVAGRFAANVDPRESEIGFPPMGLTATPLRSVEAARIGTIGGPDTTSGSELWMRCLQLALILLIIEALFLLWIESRERLTKARELV